MIDKPGRIHSKPVDADYVSAASVAASHSAAATAATAATAAGVVKEVDSAVVESPARHCALSRGSWCLDYYSQVQGGGDRETAGGEP